jgi:nucleotide-binding universal stress UspA family protein
MLPIRTILHPNDFSPYSDFAFQMACSLARDYGARLIVAYVKAPPPVAYGELGPIVPEPVATTEELKKKLMEMKPADPKIAVEYRVLEGDPASELVELAKEAHADLIVMGTHGRTGLGRLLMGSVAEAVVRRAACPVLTLKTPFPEAAAAPAPSAAEPAHA